MPAERLLAETYAIARGTVRVALHLLVKDGILEIRPGSGAYVEYNNLEKNNLMMERAKPLELIDTRFALEHHICRLAVLHASPQDFDSEEELLSKMSSKRYI